MLMDFSNADSDDPPKEIPRELYDTPVYFRFIKSSLSHESMTLHLY